MKIKMVPIGKVKPYKNNPRVNDKAVDGVARSIKDYGFQQPIVIDSKNVVIVGHTRLLAARKLGIKSVPVVVADKLNAKQVKAYRIADNRTNELADWDIRTLLNELSSIQDLENNFTGFTDNDVLKLGGVKDTGLTEPDYIPKISKKSICRIGDIWQLGEHKIICGDVLDGNIVEKVMDGCLADMAFTDPPYNTGMTKKSQAGSGGLWKGKGNKAQLSNMFDDSYTDNDWQKLIHGLCKAYYKNLKKDSVLYLCMDWRRNYQVIPHIKKNFKLSNTIVWDKGVHGLGSDYKYTYELINVCKRGKPKMDTHQGQAEYSDVWHIQRIMGNNPEHATIKPVELVERAIMHASTMDSLVIDFFLGAGSTLIACERLSRRCIGIEIVPEYCDLTIKRWQDFTGLKARKLRK